MRQIGCDAGQKCLFQRPVTPEDFTAFLREWPRRSMQLGFASPEDPAQARCRLRAPGCTGFIRYNPDERRAVCARVSGARE